MGIMKQKQEAVIGTLQWLHKSVGSTEGGALASVSPPGGCFVINLDCDKMEDHAK